MKYVLKNNELCNFTNDMNRLVNNEISERILTMQTIARDTEWEGQGRDAFVDYYETIMREIDKIPTVLNLYIDYLSNVSTNYDDTLGEVQKHVRSLQTERINKKDGD